MPKIEKFTSRGAEALFAASFFYAFTGVLVRYMSEMWGDNAQTAVRFNLVFVMMLVYGLARKTEFKIPKEKLPLAAGLTVSFALVVLFFTVAIGKTTLANTPFTFYATNMIGSFLLGTLVLKEGVTSNKIIAIIVAFVGLSLYSDAILDGNAGILLSVAAGVAAAFLWLVTLFSGGEIIRTASFKGVIYTVIFAFVLIGAANLSLYGYQHFDVNVGTVIMSMELIFGALLGWILFNEVPKSHEVLGGTLVFAGSVLGGLNTGRLSHAKTKT